MLGISGKKQHRTKPDPAQLSALYHAVTKLARAPVFYTRFAVPDTTDGRYDLLCVMLGLFLMRTQKDDPEMAQALFDLAFKDIEQGLREAGVGDLGIPKHMKRMLQAFYGRVAACYEALEQGESEGLAIVLARNLYNNDPVASNTAAAAMAQWIMIFWGYLCSLSFEDFLAEPESGLQLLPPEQGESL